MKTDIKTMWVDALRSGKYKQGQNVLRDADNKFCCLGVLCDLAVQSGLDLSVTSPDKDIDDVYTYDRISTVLPISVMNWAGITSDHGYYENNVNPQENTLSATNDSGKDFNYIADVIEREF